MSDMSKTSDQAAPLDDQSPIPAAPFSIAQDIPALDPNADGNDQSEDDKSTDREAAPFWSPAWESVQEKFEAVLDTYGQPGNAIQYKDLPADEFKIKMLTEAAVHTEITKIMEDVHRAVESVEQRPKPDKQPTRSQG
jgi:hypothetical protein